MFAVTTMMYGFGDDQTPYKESVELVEVSFATAVHLLAPEPCFTIVWLLLLAELALHSCMLRMLPPVLCGCMMC